MKKIVLAALIAFYSSGLLAAGPTTPNASGDDSQEISRLMKAGKFEDAMQRVDGGLNSRPKDPQLRFLKGLIFAEQNKTSDAIATFTKLTEDYPELPEPYNNLAVLYAGQGQYDKARAALEMAIRTNPSYATAHENLGDIYAKLASEAYGKALQLDNNASGAQVKLSLIRDLISGGKGKVPAVAAARPTPVANPTPAPTNKPAAANTPVAAAAAQNTPAASEAKPAPAVKEDSADVAAVTQALEDWAQAWARKDVKSYLAAYASDFETPAGISRSKWEQERRTRIESKKTIAVKLDNINVKLEGNTAKAHFRQYYRGDNLETKGSKTVNLIKVDGKWLIREEKSGS